MICIPSIFPHPSRYKPAAPSVAVQLQPYLILQRDTEQLSSSCQSYNSVRDAVNHSVNYLFVPREKASFEAVPGTTFQLHRSG